MKKFALFCVILLLIIAPLTITAQQNSTNNQVSKQQTLKQKTAEGNTESFSSIFKQISIHHLNILLLIGLAIFGGTAGGRLFQKLRIPKVVGYIALGILLGQTGLKLIDRNTVNALAPFNAFALGMIGFMIGGELKKETLLKQGKQFLKILFAEGLLAFTTVFLLISGVSLLLFNNLALAISLGLLLGAIASATAPAATVDVLWEYKTAGPLTNTILAIVALDDGLALLLFVTVSSLVSTFIGSAGQSFTEGILFLFYQIGGALIVGATLGLLLSFLLKRYNEKERTLTFTLGVILILIGISNTLHVDMIMAAMALGAVLSNTAPKRSEETFSHMQNFTPPIYVIFFVLIGAKLDLGNLSIITFILAATFVIARGVGKMGGARLGAKLAKAHISVQKYLPLCLFSQAGVAIGLSILAGQKFGVKVGGIALGDTIVTIITATTFIVQIIGPPLVKMAVHKAGENGMNITEEDLINSSTVGQVMDKTIPSIPENMTIKKILKLMSVNPYLYYPVINAKQELIGAITIDTLKETLAASELHGVLLAHDLVEPIKFLAQEDMPFADAMEQMRLNHLNYLPVVGKNKKKLIGFIEQRMVNQLFAKKIIEIKNELAAKQTN